MIYLVTAGSGFIGSYVVRDLVLQGHEVVCFQRSGITPLLQELIPPEKMKNVKIAQGNIKDFESLSNAIKQYDIKNIIHLAASMQPESEDNVPQAIQTTIVGTNNVLEAARTLKLNRVVWGGSNTCLGQLGKIVGSNILDDKIDAYAPPDFYAATKGLCDFMIKHYIKKYDLDIIALRLPRTYGPGKYSGGGIAFTEFIKNVALGNPVTITGADTSWGYLYVEDASSVLIKAAQVKSTVTKIFNPYDGRYHSGWELAEIIRDINPKVKVTIEPGMGKYDFPSLDLSPCSKELGFTARYPLKEGVRMFINHFRKQNNLPLL